MPGERVKIVDVAGVGINATDTIIRLPHFPAPDTKVELRDARVLPGGQVASAMVACQAWGLRTRYVGKIGEDAAGELQRREFAQAGVEAQLITAPGGLSQSAYILVDGTTGERTILWHRDASIAPGAIGPPPRVGGECKGVAGGWARHRGGINRGALGARIGNPGGSGS